MKPVVSIVIVSMNNTTKLFPCLDSIREHTSVSYETLVVAYMFTEENLAALRSEYPWVTVIESCTLRGFAENNNLALEQVQGRYCFIVNDDTFMEMPVIDRLVADMETLPPGTAAISPEIVFPDGNVQTCGRGPWTPWRYLMHYLHLIDETKPSRWTMQRGIFKTYTLNGACFLARTDIFREAGWFDQTYTFTPEDIALGTYFSKSGHPIYVDADVRITHIANATASRMETAIKPTRVRGSLIFYSRLSRCYCLTYALMGAFIWCFEALRGLKYMFCDCSGSSEKSRRNLLMRLTAANVRASIFTGMSTKEIFQKYYNEINSGKYGIIA